MSCPLETISADPQPYWRDVGTIDAYLEAHLDLLREPALFRLEDERFPASFIFRKLSPKARPSKATINGRDREGQNLISESAQIESSKLVNCIIYQGAHVGLNAELEDCIVFPGADIGQGARLRRVIVEEGVQVAPRSEAGLQSSFESRSTVVVLTTGRETSFPSSPPLLPRQETEHPTR
jgi:glucose-1-phosphate adenylyltransferase